MRFAVTGQLLPGDAYLNDSVTKVVQNSAMGFLNGANNACLVSVTYYDPSGNVTTSPTPGNVVQVSSAGICVYAPGRPVQEWEPGADYHRGIRRL